MLLPFHLVTHSFDHAPQMGVASPEWVHACLHRHPMTHHLVIRIYREAEVTILEGQVPTRHDRMWAGQVASKALLGQPMDNRLLVLDDLDGPLQPASPELWVQERQAVA